LLRRWLGPLVALLIVGGVALVLLANLETRHPVSQSPGQSINVPNPQPSPSVGSRIECPIDDSQEQNHMRIAAVWLPAVEVEGMPSIAGSDIIHLEADIHATQGNPNGFAKDEFVPYLKITYEIVPKGGGAAVKGDMTPMVAADGLHYGASVSLPKPGTYRLIYRIRPPSEGGLGRHSDRLTGVAPWWTPFDVAFDWDFPGPQGCQEQPPAQPKEAPAGDSRGN
jgi:periplasmic iron binding protein